MTNKYRVFFEPMDVISESPDMIPITFLRPEVSKIISINKEGFEIK